MSEKRILVVEDEVIVSMALQEALESLAYVVVGSVTNGPDAIHLTGLSKADLVLMDIHLDGEMDGIDAANAIFEKFCIPVVYLTAHYDENTLLRAMSRSLPYGYLTKPFKKKELYLAIESAFHKHDLLRGIRLPGLPAPDPMT
ncbi:MAG: response regulator [Methanobacteriota archaeon]|nr:MAG: response regulator [Euryarchaeota archaeon]